MGEYRKLTILHSNDMHGDFLSENVDQKLVGGVSMLSGYLNKVRSEDPNTLYLVAGDMFRGSIIDTEFKGVSTIDIMNYLAPDVVSLGNHEVDYGIAHLLFLEKCTKFPIINANLYIKTSGMRLFNSHKILQVNGMNILFIGILTEDIMAQSKSDTLLGTFVNVNAAATEVGKICDSYKSVDIDLTVLMTHIGFEEDKKLAALLDPAWGVDLIVGGHSHTILEKPEEVNGVLIVQAGQGTDQIGRFDIEVDTDTNAVAKYDWRLVPISPETCPRDEDLENIISRYKAETDKKYGRVITHLSRQLTHPRRNRETETGDLFADIFAERLGVDLVLLGSGSIRKVTFGPVVDFGELTEQFPYDGSLTMVKVNGAQLRRIFTFLFRDDAFLDDTEFYQVPHSVHLEYDYAAKALRTLQIHGEEVADKRLYTLVLQDFHFNNFEAFLGVPIEEVAENQEPKQVASSCFGILEEYLTINTHLDRKVEGRLAVLNAPDGYPEAAGLTPGK